MARVNDGVLLTIVGEFIMDVHVYIIILYHHS